MFVRDGPGVVLHDGPRGIGAEFVPPGVVKFLNGSDQRHVAVTDEVEKAVAGRDPPLRDRHHEPQIGPHDPVFDFDDLPVKPVDLVHQPGIRTIHVKFRTECRRSILEVVELPEEPHLLLTRQQRHFIEARQVGGQTRWPPHPLGRLIEPGKWLVHHPVGGLSRKECIGHAFDWQLHDVLGTLRQDHAVDAGLGAMVSLGNRFNRFSGLVVTVNPFAVFRPEAAVGNRKNGLGGMLLIMPLDGVADRLQASVETAGDPAMDIGRAGPRQRQTTGPADDPVVFFLRQLAEAAAAINAQGVVANKSIDGTGEKANTSATADEVSLGDEAMVTPAGNGLCGDVEPVRQILDRQHFVGGCGRLGR